MDGLNRFLFYCFLYDGKFHLSSREEFLVFIFRCIFTTQLKLSDNQVCGQIERGSGKTDNFQIAEVPLSHFIQQ